MKFLFWIIQIISIIKLSLLLRSNNLFGTEKPLLLENVLTNKETSVTTNFKINGDDKPKEEHQQIQDSFKEKEENIDLSNLVVPEIKRNTREIPYNPFDVNAKLAHDSIPSNLLSYDILYPTHESYYKERSYSIKDPHYPKYQEEMLGKFKTSLQKILRDMDEEKKKNLETFKEEFNSQANAQLENSPIKGFSQDNFKSSGQDKEMTIETSNPMKEIFG